MLKNEPTLAIWGVDTAKNGPSKVLPIYLTRIPPPVKQTAMVLPQEERQRRRTGMCPTKAQISIALELWAWLWICRESCWFQTTERIISLTLPLWHLLTTASYGFVKRVRRRMNYSFLKTNNFWKMCARSGKFVQISIYYCIFWEMSQKSDKNHQHWAQKWQQ